MRFRLLCKSMTSLISTTQECRLECAIFFWTSVFFYSNGFEFYLILFCAYFILELYIFLICSFMYFQVRQFPFYLTFWNQNKSLLVKILAPWVNLSLEQSHCYFTRLNLKKTGPLQFCLPALLKIHKNHTQKEFLKSCEGFLR